MKVWVSKHPYCCLTPTPVIETPMADHQQGVGGPPWVFHQVMWVYDSNMGASIPTLSYNSPPVVQTYTQLGFRRNFTVTFIDTY